MKLLVGFTLLALAKGTRIENLAHGYWLNDAVSSGARCLDGSPQFYAIRPALSSTNSSKWYFHIQGGAWCTSLDNCASRAKTRLGSSDRQFGMNETVDLSLVEGCNNSRWCGNLIVNDVDVNPLAHDWNVVLFYYCDGGSFTGNNETVADYKGQSLYFRGFKNLQAIVGDLISSHQLMQASTLVVGGDSAGGLATWIHTDYIASQLPSTYVVGLPDSGFFMDLYGFHNSLAWVYGQMNSTSGLNPACVQAAVAAGQSASQCIFAQHTAPFCARPMFALQGRFDSYQTGAILRSDDPTKVNPYGQNLQQTLLSALNIQDNGKHAVFVDSCHHHCGYWKGCIGTSIDGDYAAQAFAAFLLNTTAKRSWLQEEVFPCSSCCSNGNCADA